MNGQEEHENLFSIISHWGSGIQPSVVHLLTLPRSYRQSGTQCQLLVMVDMKMAQLLGKTA